jgi:hypothetical protein
MIDLALNGKNAFSAAVFTNWSVPACPQNAIGEKLGIYRDYPCSPGCTSPFAPIWINANGEPAKVIARSGIILLKTPLGSAQLSE